MISSYRVFIVSRLSPASLDRYLAALPAMSLALVASFDFDLILQKQFAHLFYLIRLCFSIAWLNVDDLDDSFLVVDAMASFSRAQLKPGAVENVAKVTKSEVLVR